MTAMTEKLHKSLLLAARSQVTLSDFHEGLIRTAEEITLARRGGRPPTREENTWDDDTISVEQTDELQHRQATHERLMESLAADPDLRAEMRCWMVDFSGDEQPPGTVDGSISAMTPAQLEQATLADFGVLPRLIRGWAADHGFDVTDSESGADGWLLGIPCSDDESVSLCRLAHTELGSHLSAGTLAVHIHFIGWQFKALWSVDDARQFLQAQSVS